MSSDFVLTQIVFFFSLKTWRIQNAISGVFVVTEGAHNHDSFVDFCGPVCFIPPLVVRLQIGFALQNTTSNTCALSR